MNKDKQIELIIAMTENLEIFYMKKKHERILMSTQKKWFIFIVETIDISYQALGRKDSITYNHKVDGIKQMLQKRFLLFSWREVCQLFVDEYSQHKIDGSSFQELWRPNVLYKSSINATQ